MILETGMILVAISSIIIALGYNLKLPGYNRRKMLEGTSVRNQMCDRRRIGNKLIQMGITTMSLSIFFMFIVFGLFLAVKTVETIPKKIDIMIAQGKTVIIADGEAQEFNRAHYHIRRVYFRQKFNVYGFTRVGSFRELIIEDQQDQWEVLRR